MSVKIQVHVGDNPKIRFQKAQELYNEFAKSDKTIIEAVQQSKTRYSYGKMIAEYMDFDHVIIDDAHRLSIDSLEDIFRFADKYLTTLTLIGARTPTYGSKAFGNRYKIWDVIADHSDVEIQVLDDIPMEKAKVKRASKLPSAKKARAKRPRTTKVTVPVHTPPPPTIPRTPEWKTLEFSARTKIHLHNIVSGGIKNLQSEINKSNRKQVADVTAIRELKKFVSMIEEAFGLESTKTK